MSRAWLSQSRYSIQRLAGYVDGKPSWEKMTIPGPAARDADAAASELARLREAYPAQKYRLRKTTRVSR